MNMNSQWRFRGVTETLLRIGFMPPQKVYNLKLGRALNLKRSYKNPNLREGSKQNSNEGKWTGIGEASGPIETKTSF